METPTASNHRPILLVEDNLDDIALMRRAFRKNHIANPLVVKQTSEDALAYFESEEALPNLVVLDLQIPQLSGLEVLKKIRARHAMNVLPVVILTNSKERRDTEHSYRLGANSYLCKPVDFELFLKLVGHMALYWLFIHTATINPSTQSKDSDS